MSEGSSAKDTEADEAFNRAQQQLERSARIIVASWIGHPRVRELTRGLRAWSDRELEPVLDRLNAPVDVAAFIGAGVGATRRSRSGEVRPAFASELPRALRFVGALKRTARALADAGVGIDPRSYSDIVILGQLVVFDIDWSASPSAIADELVVVAPGSISRDGRMMGVDDHATERDESSLAVLRRRRQAEGRTEGTRVPRPYAGGGVRRPSKVVERRRAALRDVRERYPDCTVASIRESWSFGPEESPGRLLRQLVKARPGEAPPSAEQIRRDLKALGLAVRP